MIDTLNYLITLLVVVSGAHEKYGCPQPIQPNIAIQQMFEEYDMKYKKGNRWKSSSGEIRYKTWRTSVFKLNRGKKGLQRYYVCEKCDKRRKTTRVLHAHHIYSWEEYPKLRYTSKNGLVLCIKCHNAFHRKYGYKSITEPSCLIEWLGKHRNKTIREYISYESKKSSKK